MKTVDGLTFQTRYGSTDESIVQNVVGDDEYGAREFIKKGDIVVDIGGHIGSFSVLAGSLGAYVFVFEPFKESFDLLVANLKKNNTPAFYSNTAVMGETGYRKMHIRQKNFGGSNFYQEPNDPTEVRCVTLDRAFKDNNLDHIDFLKLDCEGAEYEILKNYDQLPVIKMIAFEYVGNERRKEMLDLLSDYEIVKDKHNEAFGTVVMRRK